MQADDLEVICAWCDGVIPHGAQRAVGLLGDSILARQFHILCEGPKNQANAALKFVKDLKPRRGGFGYGARELYAENVGFASPVEMRATADEIHGPDLETLLRTVVDVEPDLCQECGQEAATSSVGSRDGDWRELCEACATTQDEAPAKCAACAGRGVVTETSAHGHITKPCQECRVFMRTGFEVRT